MVSHQFKTIALLAAIGLSSPCFADFYAGGAVGASRGDRDMDGTSLEVFGGYKFSDMLAVEIAYWDLGSFEERDRFGTYTTDIAGANYSLVGLLSLADGIALKAKLSFYDFEVERSLNDISAFKSQENAVNYAVGLDINTMDNVYFTLEYHYIPIKYEEFGIHVDEKYDNISLGVKFAF